MQLEIILVQKRGISKFSRFCDLTNHTPIVGYVYSISHELIPFRECLKSNLTAVGYFQQTMPLLHHSGLSCHSGLCCALQASQLGRTTDPSSSLAVSNTMKAIPQGGGFQIRPSSIPLYPKKMVSSVIGFCLQFLGYNHG